MHAWQSGYSGFTAPVCLKSHSICYEPGATEINLEIASKDKQRDWSC